ncbi:MAG: glycosyltransferase [Deltaproteobacteria bacterium]|nr:glycosyltransferase [Deltaproteobacteria bacterium]
MFSKVSVIIPALNEERHIGQCLGALSEIDRAGLPVEVIVVDNGSTDRTVEIARQAGVRVLERPGIRIAAMRNAGVASSKGDLLAFVDGDCVVKKDWLTSAIKAIKREGAAAVGSFHITPEEAGWIGRTAEALQSTKVGSRINYIPSGNLIATRAAFEKVRGFNEALETSEDVDFCHRLKEAGFKLFIDPAISSVHHGAPKTVSEMFAREMWHGKNTCTVFINDLLKARNRNLILFSGINLVLLLSMLAGAIVFLLAGHPALLLAAAALYLALNLLLAIKDRKKTRYSLVSLFFYDIIYGLARSASIVSWALRSIFSGKAAKQ